MGPLLACVGLLHLLVIWLSWFFGFSQVMGTSAFLRCHGADLRYVAATKLCIILQKLSFFNKIFLSWLEKKS
jgi:hypothetical protein